MSSSALDNTDTLTRKYFLPYQVAWLNDASDFKIFEKSRRVGGSYVQSFEDVRDLIRMKHLPGVYFSSADLTAAKLYIDYAVKWARAYNLIGAKDGWQPFEEDGVKGYQLHFAGKFIHALSSNPNAFRSKGGKLVLDEFGRHKDDEELWGAANPITTWGYPTRIISTHNGKGTKFYRLIEDVRAKRIEGSVHTVTLEQAVEQGLYDKIMRRPTTELERKVWVQKLRSKYTAAVWQQEYCCIPADESAAFLTYSMILAVERPDVLTDLANVKGDLYLGFDVSRRQHFSVIYVLEQLGHILYVRKIVAMRNHSFAAQKQILYPLLNHPNMRRACIDATGLGMQIAEEAQTEFGKFKVEAVTFSGKVKEELAYGLYTDVEDRTLFMPRDELARESLHSVKKVTTAANNIRFDADATEETGHGDHFWALALARNAARSGKGGDPQVMSEPAGGEESEDMRAFMQAFAGYRRESVQSF